MKKIGTPNAQAEGTPSGQSLVSHGPFAQADSVATNTVTIQPSKR